jgi:MFS family permease
MPMVLASMAASAGIGQVISRTGRYKRWMLLGAGLLTAGLGLMATLSESTSLVWVGVFQVVVGLGMGMLMQNLVLVAQNSLSFDQMGAGSALVAFFRSLAGAAGVAVLGAVLASEVAQSIAAGLAANGVDAGALASGSGSLPDVRELSEPLRGVVEHAYGVGIAEIFMFAAPLGLIALVAIVLLPEKPLGTVSGIEAAARAAEADGAEEAAMARPTTAEREPASAAGGAAR